MPGVQLTYDTARGWVGPSISQGQAAELFDGNTVLNFTNGVRLGNGDYTFNSADDLALQWNYFWLQRPTIPADAFPVQLQMTWFVTQVQFQGLPGGETVIIQAAPQPYSAGEARIVPTSGGWLSGAYAANMPIWNAAWPLDSLQIAVLASAETHVSEVIAVLYYTLPPIVAGLRVSPISGGVIATTVRPSLSWGFAPGQSDIPGIQQDAFQVRLFTSSQAAVPGFDPGTSPATWDSGQIRSSAGSYQIPINLANSTSYVARVRVGNMAGGQMQWSSWAAVSFTISIPPAAVPARPTVTAVADSANARITLTVTQSGGTPAWDHVIVQRSVDSGASWQTVRNGDTDIAAGATLAIWDYETGNGQAAMYRAQAQRSTTAVGGFTQVSVSQWSAVTASTSWSSPYSWLKAPFHPAQNTAVHPTGVVTWRRPVQRGVFQIAGRRNPIVVSDVRGGRTGTLSFTTVTAAEGTAVASLLDLGEPLLYQPAPAWASDTVYLSPGDLDENPPADDLTYRGRYWSFDATEIDSPAGDAVMGTPVAPPPAPTDTFYLLDENGARLTDEAGNELVG